jgi:hypothetical protein
MDTGITYELEFERKDLTSEEAGRYIGTHLGVSTATVQAVFSNVQNTS